MVIPFIFHLALGKFSFPQFFQECRLRQIQFDFKVRLGTTFSIYDEFLKCKPPVYKCKP